MKKIRRASIAARASCFVAFFLMLIALPALLWFILTTTESMKLLSFTFPENMSAGDKFITLAPDILSFVFYTAAAFFSYRFFHYLAQGELFETRTIRTLKRAGWFFLSSAAFYVLLAVAIRFLFPNLYSTTHLEPQSYVSGYTGLTIPFLTFLIAWILDEGRKLKEQKNANSI